jgi:hypothetical protein
MSIDGVPNMKRKRKRKIKWKKLKEGKVKGKQEPRGPKSAQEGPK